ncbi:hypothetical protein [Micromonospora sp. LOL_023]|uniref:hypothetical protein n=1 Tax=Micromonospora sp. LOL_023 TaxID=3345418 RepID=UPI003A8BB15D
MTAMDDDRWLETDSGHEHECQTDEPDPAPSQDEIDQAARDIRAAHHSPDGRIWPKCGQCHKLGCESLEWAIVQLDKLRDRLVAEGKRDDPEFAWLDGEDRECHIDLPTAGQNLVGAAPGVVLRWTYEDMKEEHGESGARMILADLMDAWQENGGQPVTAEQIEAAGIRRTLHDA